MKELLLKGKFLFLGHIFGLVSGLILVPVIIRLGDVETLGIFSLYSTAISFLFGISSFGVGFRARRYMPGLEDPRARASLFYPQLCFQTLIVLLLAVLASIALPRMVGLLADNMNRFAITSGVIIAYLVSQLLYSHFTDYFRYTHRVGVYTIATTITPYIALVIMAVAYARAQTLLVEAVFLSQAAAMVGVGFLLLVKTVQEIGLKLTLPSFDALKGDIRLGLPLVLAYVVDVVLAGSDRFVLAGVLSVKEVGFYVPAYSLGMLIMLLPRMLGVLLPPIISRDVDTGQRQHAELAMEGAARGYFLVSMTFAAGAVALGKPVLALYATEEVASLAWPIIPIVAIGAIFYGLMLIYATVLSVQLRTRDMFYATLLAAVLNLGLNVIFLPLFRHILVTAVTTTVAYVIAWMMVRSKVRACWPLTFPAVFLMRAAVVAALTGGVAFMVYSMALLMLNPVGALSFALGLAFFAFILLLGVFRLAPRVTYAEMYSFLFHIQ